MNTIASSPKEKPGDNKPSEGIQESIFSNQHETNIADGSEFLDDAIRMKEQPFGETIMKEEE